MKKMRVVEEEPSGAREDGPRAPRGPVEDVEALRDEHRAQRAELEDEPLDRDLVQCGRHCLICPTRSLLAD